MPNKIYLVYVQVWFSPDTGLKPVSFLRYFKVHFSVVSQIDQQVMTSPASADRYTSGFLTGRLGHSVCSSHTRRP